MKNVSLFILLIFFVLCIISAGGRAMEDALSREDLFFMDVPSIVSASILKGLGNKQLPAQIRVISREEIKLTGARNLPELIQLLVPGASVVEDTDDHIIAFRGMMTDNNNMTLLLLNGQNICQEMNQGASSLMGQMNLTFIERIEVVTGSGSATFGVGPIIGVINIITSDYKDNKDMFLKAGVDYGSGKHLDEFVYFNAVGDNGLKMSGNVSFNQRKDGFSIKEGNGDWPMPAVKKYYYTYPSFNFVVDAEYKDAKFTFFQFDQMEFFYSSPDTFQRQRTQGGKFEKNIDISERWSFTPSFYWKRNANNWGINLNNPAQNFWYGEEIAGTSLKAQYSAEELKFVFGSKVDHYNWGKDPFTGLDVQYDLGTGPLWDPEGNTIPSVPGTYYKATYSWASTDYNIFSEIYYQFSEKQSVMLSGLFARDDNRSENNFAPRIAYLYNSGESWWGDIVYSRSFRTPPALANHLIPPGGFVRHYNEPNLKTEVTDNIEVHLMQESTLSQKKLTLFFTRYNDIFSTTGPGLNNANFDPDKFLWSWSNTQDIDSAGLEASFIWKPTRKLNMEFSGSYVKVVGTKFNLTKLNAEQFVDFDGNHFLGAPEIMLKANTTYKATGSLVLRADMYYDPGRYRATKSYSTYDTVGSASGLVEIVGPNKSDAWFNLNLSAAFSLTDNFELTGHIFNVFDSRPYTACAVNPSVSYTPLPISYKIGVTYRFGDK